VTMPATSPSLMTAAELAELHIPNKSTELVRGRLIVREPPSTYHGQVSGRLTYLLGHHIYDRGVGEVFGQDTGFHIFSNPDSVRAPDVAFVRKERLERLPRRGFARLAPELCVEVMSPDDRPGEVLSKVGDWLEAGVVLVWVIDPAKHEARVYRADGSIALVHADGVLEGEEVLPGFALPLAEVLR